MGPKVKAVKASGKSQIQGQKPLSFKPRDAMEKEDSGESGSESPKGKMHGSGDFERFVKDTLERMEKKIDQSVGDQRDFKEHLTQMEQTQENFERSLQHSSDDMEELRNNHVAAERRISELEKTVNRLSTQLKETMEENIRLQRYSRGFNLRFGGIKEEPGESCTEILTDLVENKLGFGAGKAASMIENAHRVAPASSKRKGKGPPSHIIVKFMRRPERLQVLRKAKQVLKGSEMFITEDLCPADFKRKKAVSGVMKEAYEQGKKARFSNGRLYIDGELYEPN